MAREGAGPDGGEFHRERWLPRAAPWRLRGGQGGPRLQRAPRSLPGWGGGSEGAGWARCSPQGGPPALPPPAACRSRALAAGTLSTHRTPPRPPRPPRAAPPPSPRAVQPCPGRAQLRPPASPAPSGPRPLLSAPGPVEGPGTSPGAADTRTRTQRRCAHMNTHTQRRCTRRYTHADTRGPPRLLLGWTGPPAGTRRRSLALARGAPWWPGSARRTTRGRREGAVPGALVLWQIRTHPRASGPFLPGSPPPRQRARAHRGHTRTCRGHTLSPPHTCRHATHMCAQHAHSPTRALCAHADTVCVVHPLLTPPGSGPGLPVPVPIIQD
uniref:uncharacterized protein LOC129511892 isoform X2 n=1 Tax=Nyctereutes procyonoides TaxID=34880 RepID=UPI002443A85D|nr:uncharacterized protein LOC129511892 isoform X2 [Nyctereutes procyonoides]